MADTILPFNVTAGISAAGDIAFSGAFAGTTGAFSKLLTASAGLSASGATFSGSISAPNIVNSWNGSTGAVIFTNYVASFNGLTGAVTGVTVGGANTFTALNSFGAGISASGATFSADIAVNGVRVGRGAGSIATNTVLGTGAGAANTTGANNIFVGSAAGDALTTGSRNISIGSDALGAGVTANDNVAIGHNALLLVSSGVADGTVAIGSYALDALTTGTLNTAIGYNALGKTNTGSGNVAIGYLALENATTPSNNVAIGRYALNAKTSSGDGNVAIGTNAMVYASNGSNNTAIGQQVMGGAATTGSYNSAIGNAALYALTTGQYNNAMGTYSLYALTTGSLNCGVGMDTLTSLTTGSSNTAIGGAAMRGVSSGDYNVAIGQNAGRYYGAAGITLTTILNNSTYIGYGTKPSADSVTNEMALGYIALGLGSNTTVIGNSSTTATTIYGLLNAPSGISAASGATFTGTISLNGQTFANLVNSVNGYTGAVGGWINAPGFTSSAQTWTDGTNNGAKTIYYLPTHYLSQADWGSYVVAANRTYYSLYNTSKPLTIKTIRALANSTTTTGNAFISIYSADSNTGLPSTRLYLSASLAVGSGYSGVSVTNASGLVTVPAGFYYVAVTFSSTPTMFAFNRYRIPGIFGASSYSAGPFNMMPISDHNGYTAAAQLPTSGVTLGYLENSAGSYVGPVVEIAI